MQNKCLIVSLGEVEEIVIEEAMNIARDKFLLLPEYYGKIDPSAEGSRNSQLNGEILLLQIASIKEEDTLVTLGLTRFDLFADNLNFIFGIASSKLRSCLISYARLITENFKLFISRLRKEITHELGHVFGLPHCKNPYCVMHFSNSILDTDRKSENFCDNCRRKLLSELKQLGLL
jgi:archaemetzincin